MPKQISDQHHWEVLNLKINDIIALGNITKRLNNFHRDINNALLAVNNIQNQNNIRITADFDHLNEWNHAIVNFRSQHGI